MSKKSVAEMVVTETLDELLQEANTDLPGSPHEVSWGDETRFVWSKSVGDCEKALIRHLGVKVRKLKTQEIVREMKEATAETV